MEISERIANIFFMDNKAGREKAIVYRRVRRGHGGTYLTNALTGMRIMPLSLLTLKSLHSIAFDGEQLLRK